MNNENVEPQRLKGDETPDSWEAIYRSEEPSWDIGHTPPPFQAILDRPPAWLPKGSLLYPGSGRGHDAAAFAQQGFQVTAVDFAPSAISGVARYAKKNPNLRYLESDFFCLPRTLNESFDYILEHTFFCAIPVYNREHYVETVIKLLRPGGILFGLFFRFDAEDNDGPPFCVNDDQIKSLFSEQFDFLDWYTPQVSHGNRAGRERFIAMRLK